MPPKPRGKKSQSSAKKSTETTAQRKKSPLKRPPAQTRSPATKTPATAGKTRGKPDSPGASREKRLKTRPLTAADIPDIVSAVVKAMPQPAEADTIATPRRPSRCKQINSDPLAQQPTVAPQTRRRLPRRRIALTTETPTTKILVSY